MKATQSLTAALVAAAMVGGIGLAVAQTSGTETPATPAAADPATTATPPTAATPATTTTPPATTTDPGSAPGMSSGATTTTPEPAPRADRN